MKNVLIAAAAALTFGGALGFSAALCAQGYNERGPFEGAPLGEAPLPPGRAPDTRPDSPQRVDFGVDFAVNETPLDPRNDAAARRDAPRATSDRAVDEPLQAAVHNGYDPGRH